MATKAKEAPNPHALVPTAEVGTLPEAEATALVATPQVNPYDITSFQMAGGFWTSLNLKDDRHKRLAMRALTTGGEPLNEHINDTLEVVNVIIHGIEMTDTNEKSPNYGVVSVVPRTVLFCSDGTMYQAVSEGVMKSLRFLAAMIGPPPWNPPARVTVKQINTRSGRRYFVLDLPSELPL